MTGESWRRAASCVLIAAWLAVLGSGGSSAQQIPIAEPPLLFDDAGVVADAALARDDAHVIRSRVVSVDLDRLFDARGNPRDATRLPEVGLNLFDDASFTGVVTSVQQDRWATSWSGQLKGGGLGYFYLVVADGAFIAHVASLEGVYEVSGAGNGVYKAIQIDQSRLVDEDPNAVLDPPGEVTRAGDLGSQADSGSIIDIMVVYTATARAAEGSTAAMKARIALAVLETNTSYANSGVTPRLRLVHVEEYAYAETGNLETDLNRLTSTTDGYFTTVHTLRNTFGADMVGLIVENGGAYCGLANAIKATSSNAFQVTDRSCATGYYSFGHEFGHLQGARHDTYVDPTTTPYSYGHGYAHRGSSAAQRWRTVMAYNDYCSVVGYDCTRLQWWSNPAKTRQGSAMGSTTAKNYLVLNTTRSTVANFRTVKIGDNFSSSFNGSSSGWSAVRGSWALNSGQYYKTAGLANTGASAKHSGVYGDLTYEVRMWRSDSSDGANRIIIRGNPASLDSTNWWKPSYAFQYSNSGSFSVYSLSSGGVFTALKAWTTSGAIVQRGWNTLKVIAVGSSLNYYINGTLVWSGTDTALATGTVGFGFYRDAAAGTLYVNWANLSNTPTADLNQQVAAEGVVVGGTVDRSW